MEHRTRRFSSPETRGSAWTRPRHAREGHRLARPRKSRRLSRVAIGRPARPSRPGFHLRHLRIKRIISPSLRHSIAVCQVSRSRPAAPRRATRGTRAIPASRRLPGLGSGRRGALEGARGRTRRPARGGRRSDGTNNRTCLRQRQFVCRARPHERTARAVLLFGDWLLQKTSRFARLCGRRPLVADPLLSPRHRSPRTSFRTLRPVATAL